MLAVRIILFILTIVALKLSSACFSEFKEDVVDDVDVFKLMRYSRCYNENERRCYLIGRIMLYVSVILGITFCVLLICTNCNWYTIPKILLLILIYLYIGKEKVYIPLLVCVGATFIFALVK